MKRLALMAVWATPVTALAHTGACHLGFDDVDSSGVGGDDTSGPIGPSSVASSGTGGDPLGAPVSGNYQASPVAWEGSPPNACGPYPPAVEMVEGPMLAALGNEYAADGSSCDACIEVVDAEDGKSVIARVITYGAMTAPGNVDLSQPAYDAIAGLSTSHEMTWRLVSCPSSGPLYFQFQGGGETGATSVWVRNPRIAIDEVEVKSANHASYLALDRGPDGAFTDAAGFGDGAFTLRVIGVDGSSLEQSFAGFTPGTLVGGDSNL